MDLDHREHTMSLRSRHALQFTWNTAAAGCAFFGQEITSHKERLADQMEHGGVGLRWRRGTLAGLWWRD
jgi:hypothetical protein